MGKDYQRGHNYIFNEIEEDADERGFSATALIYDKAGNKKIASIVRKEGREKYERRKLHIEYVTTTENGKEIRVTKEKYNTENIRRIVKQNKNLLKEYPSLKHLFTSDGDPKSLDEMLCEAFIAHSIDKMHKDLIIHDIRYNGLKTVSFQNKTDEQLRITIRRLNDMLFYETDAISKIIKDEQLKNNQNMKQILVKSLDIHLMTVMEISNFISRNKDLIKQYDNNHKDKNSDLYGTYEYRIRMLMNTIDEHKNKNTLGYLEEPLKKYEPNLRKFDYDIRRDYMEYIKSHFTKEELETRVHFDSRTISLKRFIDEDIFKHMDRNHYLHKNDGTYVKSSDGTVVVSITKFVREILEKCSIKTTKYSKELNDMFDYQEPTTSTTKQSSIVA